jgi:hypothetical protein
VIKLEIAARPEPDHRANRVSELANTNQTGWHHRLERRRIVLEPDLGALLRLPRGWTVDICRNYENVTRGAPKLPKTGRPI